MKKMLSIALCMLLITACMASAGMAEETALNTLYSSEISTLNYLTTSTTKDFAVSANVIDTLVEYDRYGNIQPSLAEKWEMSKDGLTWTFHLRKDAVWVNAKGEVQANVTANDFVSAAKYLLDDKNASSTADLFYGVVAGAKEYYQSTVPAAEGEAAKMPLDFETVGVKALDDYTLQYTLAYPCAYFESMMTYVCFMPVYGPFLEEKGDRFGVADDENSILYCGAYILSEFKPQEVRVLSKNPAYWDKDNVKIETIRSTFNKEASSIGAEMYKRGEIDSATIDVTTAASWLKDPETEKLIRPVRQTSFYSYFYCLNFDANFDEAYEPENWTKAVNNEAFRKSLYHGLDRVKAMLITEPDNPESIIFNTIVPPDFATLNGVDYTLLGDLKAITEQGTGTFDEEKALTYKAQAIEELTAAGATFPVKILLKYNPSVSGWDSECLVIEQQLEALLGTDYIDVIVEAGPSDGFLSAVRRSGNYALLKCNWGPDYADPQTFLDPFKKGNNYAFMDKSADTEALDYYYGLVEEAKNEAFDLAARYEAFAKAEAFLINHAYVIPFGFGNGGYVASRIDPFTSQFASYGFTNERYKGSEMLSEPMDTDAYFDAYDQWIEERASQAK